MKPHKHEVVSWLGRCECGAYQSGSGQSWFKIEGAIPAKAKLSPAARRAFKDLDRRIAEFKTSLPIR